MKLDTITLTAGSPLDDLIRSLHATAPDRVFSASFGGNKLWIKTAGPPRLHSLHLLQRVLAALLGLPLLKPPRLRSGAAGLAEEAVALRRLAAAGFPVPKVIACSSEYLVLGDTGTGLEPILNSISDPDERWTRIAAAGALLLRLHDAGLWHGGAQIRNFTWQNDAPALLDLEDHDLPGMNLAERQARDLLLFLYSLTRYDRHPAAPRLTAQAATMLTAAKPEIREALRRLRQRLASPLALARRLAPHAGRDVRQAAAADIAIGAALAQMRD